MFKNPTSIDDCKCKVDEEQLATSIILKSDITKISNKKNRIFNFCLFDFDVFKLAEILRKKGFYSFPMDINTIKVYGFRKTLKGVKNE